MNDRPRFQFRLSTALVLVTLIAGVLGAVRLPIVLAAYVFSYAVAITFIVAALGAITKTGRPRLVCIGAGLGLLAGVALRIANEKCLGGVQWLSYEGERVIAVLMKINGQQSWGTTDMTALDSVWANLSTLALACCGAVLGLVMGGKRVASHEERENNVVA